MTLEDDTDPIRVLLADNHHLVRLGVRSALERHTDIAVVGEAVDGRETFALARKLRPDVIILDVNMPDAPCSQAIARLNGLPPATTSVDVLQSWPPHILILSAHCERACVNRLLMAGAKGYLLKDEPPERIVEGVRQVMRGEPALSTLVQKMLLTHVTRPAQGLSLRELEVLRLVARGYTNEEIATALTIAVGTVKNHVTNIYRKLPNIRTRSEAVAWAWQNRIVEVRPANS